VHIESSDPSKVLVAPNANSVAATFLDIPVANGATTASFYIVALEGASGTATIMASAPGFNPDSGTVNIVQPALRLEGLASATTSLSADINFYARVGIPSAGNSGLSA